LNLSISIFACVPLPAPGAPSRTTRDAIGMNLREGTWTLNNGPTWGADNVYVPACAQFGAGSNIVETCLFCKLKIVI
jgi:hypothetical protein